MKWASCTYKMVVPLLTLESNRRFGSNRHVLRWRAKVPGTTATGGGHLVVCQSPPLHEREGIRAGAYLVASVHELGYPRGRVVISARLTTSRAAGA